MPMSSFRGRCGIFRFATAAACFWRAAHIDGMTLDYREGWPRVEGLRGAGRISQRRHDRAAHRAAASAASCWIRRMRASPTSRTASSRFMRPRTAMRAMRCGTCARRRSTPWPSTPSPSVEAQGPLQAHRESVPAVQGFRASPGAGARRVCTAHAESRGIDARGDRFGGRCRYRRRSGGARRHPRPRSGRSVSDDRRARRAIGR